MSEETELEPQSFIRIHPRTIFWQIGTVVFAGSLIAGFICSEVSRRLDVGIGASLLLCCYFILRARSWRRGFYLYEHEGEIIWYVGYGSEQRISIKDIASIDRFGKGTLINGSCIQLPKPYSKWFPFYLYLYQEYQHLFADKPRIYKGRAV